MAKSKNGATEQGKLEDPKNEEDANTEVPGQSSWEPPAREVPKQSRRGKGGGPKTKAGKLAVSRNAVKHGIMSKSPVIPGMETEEEWQAHRAATIESLEPVGQLETVLAERIAFSFWRFLRVARYEAAVIAKGVAYAGVTAALPDARERGALAGEGLRGQPSAEVEAEAETWLLPSSFHLDRIMRYDGTIQRQLVQTYNLLDAVQARRQGQPVNHTRVDISSPPQFRNTRAPALSDALANLA